MRVFGHTVHQEVLGEAPLPPALLFVGPKSVGKTTLAFGLAESRGIARSDILYKRKLTVEGLSHVAEAAQRAPRRSEQQMFILNMDAATSAAPDVLLKTLEESPVSTRFILIASAMPKATIASRTHIFRFSLLSDEEVEAVLLTRNFEPNNAKRLAKLARGQVQTALNLASKPSEEKTTVLLTIRALLQRDEDALNAMATRWTPEHINLMTTLAYEAITGQWRMFQSAEVEGLTSPMALKILTAMKADIRPRLVVHSSLMKILKENR